jgi:hypothetical protein
LAISFCCFSGSDMHERCSRNALSKSIRFGLSTRALLCVAHVSIHRVFAWSPLSATHLRWASRSQVRVAPQTAAWLLQPLTTLPHFGGAGTGMHTSHGVSSIQTSPHPASQQSCPKKRRSPSPTSGTRRKLSLPSYGLAWAKRGPKMLHNVQ